MGSNFSVHPNMEGGEPINVGTMHHPLLQNANDDKKKQIIDYILSRESFNKVCIIIVSAIRTVKWLSKMYPEPFLCIDSWRE